MTFYQTLAAGDWVAWGALGAGTLAAILLSAALAIGSESHE